MPAKTHGMSRTRIYYMWKNMKGRCTRESCDRWSRYGGRGIKVEEPWFSSLYHSTSGLLSTGIKNI